MELLANPWVLAVVFLLGYEAYALIHRRPTLSCMMRRWWTAWPFFGVLVGFVCGSLLTHFFWVWCP